MTKDALPRGPKGKSRIRTTNAAEVQVLEALEQAGWSVLKRGWPDFLAVKGTEVRFIEVKPDSRHKLKPDQERVKDILGLLGLKVEVLTPDNAKARADE